MSATRMALGREEYKLDQDTFVWNNRMALGGLLCSIRGKFLVDPSVAGTDQRRLKGMEFVPDTSAHSGSHIYQVLGGEFEDAWGEPVFEFDPFPPEKLCLWVTKELVVIHKLEGQDPIDLCKIEVWQQPLPNELWANLGVDIRLRPSSSVKNWSFADF